MANNEDFFSRRAEALVRVTAERLGIVYPTSDWFDLVLLADAVRRDNLFVSEAHPIFTDGPLVVETYVDFAHYYVRLDPADRKITVSEALALLDRATANA